MKEQGFNPGAQGFYVGCTPSRIQHFRAAIPVSHLINCAISLSQDQALKNGTDEPCPLSWCRNDLFED
jgi:hypothetical protein